MLHNKNLGKVIKKCFEVESVFEQLQKREAKASKQEKVAIASEKRKVLNEAINFLSSPIMLKFALAANDSDNDDQTRKDAHIMFQFVKQEISDLVNTFFSNHELSPHLKNALQGMGIPLTPAKQNVPLSGAEKENKALPIGLMFESKQSKVKTQGTAAYRLAQLAASRETPSPSDWLQDEIPEPSDWLQQEQPVELLPLITPLPKGLASS